MGPIPVLSGFCGLTSCWVPISVGLFGPGCLSSLAMIALERKATDRNQ